MFRNQITPEGWVILVQFESNNCININTIQLIPDDSDFYVRSYVLVTYKNVRMAMQIS